MRVLVLSWDVADAAGGPSPSAALLARALADAGDRVRLVTRHPEGGVPGSVDGVEVHAVPDAAPIIPLEVGGQLSRVLAFSSRATTAAIRLLEAEQADVCFVDGWQPTYTATAIRSTHDVPLVAGLDASWFARRAPHLETRGQSEDDTLLHQIEWWLTYEARRIVSPTRDGLDDLARVLQIPADKLALLPIPQAAPRISGPPSPRAPVLVQPPTDQRARPFLLAVRRHMHDPSRLTSAWRQRPAMAVVLDAAGRHLAVRAAVNHVPVAVLDQPGLVGLVADGRGWLVPDPTPAAVAATIEQIRDAGDVDDRTRLAARVAADQNAPSAVVDRFHDIAAAAAAAEADLRDAAVAPPLRPVPPPAPSA